MSEAPASVPGTPSPRGTRPGPPGLVPARVLRDASWPGSGAVVHDAVVAAAGAGAAGAGAAGAGAVAGQHLRGGPAVQLHQVPLGSAAVQPGVAEMVPEPVPVGVHAALPAAPRDHLV